MHPCSSSCFILTLLACFTPTLSSNPPLGNSIALSASTLDGMITYSCRHGTWLPVSMATTLVKIGDEQKLVGSYLRTFSNVSQRGTALLYDSNDNAGTWSLINADGDEAESGHSTSLVAGRITSSLPRSSDSAAYMWDFLSQASFHQFDGEASRVSYIMQKNAVRNERPPAHCTQDEKYTLNMTYKAEYIFWKQDMVPPAIIPPQIMVDLKHEQFVEAFFAVGMAVYVAVNGSTWAYKGAEGRLYEVPGGEELGFFHMNGSLLCLRTEVAASGDASACATPLPNIRPVVVNSLSLPWFLMSITNSSGNLINFGSLSSIQMVSTFGGVAPSTPPNTLNGENKSSFTAIFWIYTYKK